MKVLVKLKKSWRNGDSQYEAGQILNLSDENAKRLIDSGTAENYFDQNSIDKYRQANSIFSNFGDGGNEHEFAGVSMKKFWRRSDTDSTGEKTLGDVLKKAAAGMSEGVGSDGGYAVPVQFHNTIVSDGLESDDIISRCFGVNMQTNQVEIPAIADYDRSTGLYEIDVPQTSEAGTLSNKKLKIEKMTLKLNKSGFLLPLSNELLEDCPQLAADIAQRVMSECLVNETILQIVNGTGVNQSLGILNSPALITVAKETGQAAATICYENVVKMFARANTRTKKNGVWLCSPDCVPQIFALSLAIGTGGSHVSLIQNIGERPVGAIFGRPILFTEHCSALGTLGDILFCNLADYAIARKANDPIRISNSPHLGFSTDEHYFRVISRFDGQPLLSKAQTPANGGPTLSSFVGLATRA